MPPDTDDVEDDTVQPLPSRISLNTGATAVRKGATFLIRSPLKTVPPFSCVGREGSHKEVRRRATADIVYL